MLRPVSVTTKDMAATGREEAESGHGVTPRERHDQRGGFCGRSLVDMLTIRNIGRALALVLPFAAV
jgi:hypothetical protein